MSEHQIEQIMQRFGCGRIQAINHLRGRDALRLHDARVQKLRVDACVSAWRLHKGADCIDALGGNGSRYRQVAGEQS